jgi:tellurite resistance protein
MNTASTATASPAASGSAWAYSFPLAAMTIASFRMGERTALDPFTWLAVALLRVTTLVVLLLVALTMRSAAQGKICVPE